MDDQKNEIKMARLGGAGACLCDRLAGGVLVYSEDGVVLVKEKGRIKTGVRCRVSGVRSET